MISPNSFELEVGGRKLTIDTGKLAGQACGAVTARYGDTVVLITVCTSAEPREGVDFLPLTVDYEERLYAAGKIPGGFIRREGAPAKKQPWLADLLTDRYAPFYPRHGAMRFSLSLPSSPPTRKMTLTSWQLSVVRRLYQSHRYHLMVR